MNHQHITTQTCPYCLAILVQVTADRRRARLALRRRLRRAV